MYNPVVKQQPTPICKKKHSQIFFVENVLKNMPILLEVDQGVSSTYTNRLVSIMYLTESS